MSASIAVALNSPPTSRVNGRAGMLANRLLESVKGGSSLTDPEPWSLLEEVLGIVATAEKRIAEQRNRIETLESMVMTDPLTELENRRGFETHLDRILAAAKRHDDTGVLVYIDMDNFKVTNDKYGHEAGDAVLVSVAEVLRKNTRTSDVVARIGGDEFAVLLTHTGPAEGLYRSRRLNTFLSQADAHYRDLTLELRASFGTAPYGPETDKKDLLRRADSEMYKEKRDKNRPRVVAA